MKAPTQRADDPTPPAWLCPVTKGLLAFTLAALLGLHLAEPDLGMTWSYAHLGRHPALPLFAVALAILAPIAGARAWSSGLGRTPPRAWPPAAVALAVLLLWAALAAIVTIAPVRSMTPDGRYFTEAIATGQLSADRWFLAVRTLKRAARWTKPEGMRIEHFISLAHALLGSIAIAAFVGACRLLARETREAWALALIACSAFGVVQLVPGYIDIYPWALAVSAVFVWLALGALAGERHPACPTAVAAGAPFVYLGLLLLAPPAAVVLFLTLRRPNGVRRTLEALLGAVLAAGAAAFPLRGIPFDWVVAVQRAWEGRAMRGGFLTDSSLLPGWYVWSSQHVAEVASTLLLIDPVGCTLLVIAGGALLAHDPRRALDPPSLVLLAFVASSLAYLWVMDPVFGAFSDWDLFSYCAVGTSLLGAYAFVRLGRLCP